MNCLSALKVRAVLLMVKNKLIKIMIKNKIYFAYITMAVLLVAIIITGVIIVFNKRNHDSQVDSFGEQVNELKNKNDNKSQAIDSLNNSRDSLEQQIEKLQAKIAELNENFENAGTIYAEEVAGLYSEIEIKNAEIASLEADIARYETVYTIDVREQARLIDELIEYIETKCPYVRMVDTVEVDNKGIEIITYKWVKVAELEAEMKLAAEIAGEEYIEGRVLEREDVFYPNISAYYEDLATGYHFGYNDDYTYNSASVIKAPFILSVLQVISADEQSYIDRLKADGKYPDLIDTDGDGIAETEKIEYSAPIYDLSETVVYNRTTMYKSGSGKIMDMEDGTVFSYLDFIKYALEFSDNVAYQQLRSRFGFNTMTSLARKVGASSVLKNGNNMTALDAGKLFKAIYNFVDEDEKYGAIMEQSMSKSNHTVIIPYGVSPSKSLHKYGWDTNSYHDAAVVLYGDKPYVLAIFSDLDKGGDEINVYLREIVKKINTLHKNFYK